MSRFTIPRILFIFLSGWCFFTSSLYAAEIRPSQDITISFNLDTGTLYGNSTLYLPPETTLTFFINGLAHFNISRIASDINEPVSGTSQDRITLPANSAEQKFSLSWQLTPSKNGHGADNLITPKGIALTGLWHPIPDRDIVFSLKAELPAGFSGITEANRLTIQTTGHKRILRASAPQPLRSINFAAGPYRVHSRKVGATTLYTYFFAEDAKLSREYLRQAERYIRYYEQLIGPFPYERYSLVENRLPTGYGMPGFTLLGQAVIRLPFIKDTSLGHEILHSWFGNSLQNDDSGNWCEGLTTSLADLHFAGKQGRAKWYRKNQILRYQALIHKDNLITLADFQHGGDSQPMARKMRAIGYDKGSMFFHMLRREVGDKAFFKTLKLLYKKYKFTRVGWAEIETLFSREAGQDLTRFFGQWLLRNDIPDISIRDINIEQDNGSSIVSFTLVQKNKHPYLLKIPIIIETLNGSSRQIIQVTSQNEKIDLLVDSLPTALHLDPEYDLMRTLTSKELPPAWIRFLGAEQKTVVLPGTSALEPYLPLMATLEQQGCKLVPADEIKNSDLNHGSFVFLGESRHIQGLFAQTEHAPRGFTLDVRNNPLARGEVMVLISSESSQETSKIVHKLNHYGKYSFLHFLDGKIREKKITRTENGVTTALIPLPQGIPVKKITPFETIIDQLLQSRVIYVGETHTDFGDHILQLQVIQALFAKNPQLMIGMEMFPRSSQQALDDYISGKITDEREFLRAANYFSAWGFDYRLYRDIINFAKKHHLPLKGLNLDKKIVSTVFKEGATDSLNDQQWEQVAADRDLTLPGYRQRLEEIHSLHAASPHGANFAGFLQAQSMWDETMAETIVQNLQENPEKKMVVIAGTGHVYKDSAIPPRVARRVPVKQTVLIANNGMDTGDTRGKHADYLMFTQSVTLSPAGKIGIVLTESKGDGDTAPRISIVQINPAGKADEAGLKAHDIILEIDGFPVAAIGDLKAGLADKNPGDTVVLKIQRNNENLDIPVELSDMTRAAMTMPPGHPGK
ncbi:MAG: hypothetical protein DSY58_09285 [Desulfobulbus sp.]|nr:MAG: hypothetical protein DSY58_09285 [Desulfobulbus sp.]